MKFTNTLLCTIAALSAVALASQSATANVVQVSGTFESSGYVDTFTGGTFDGSFSFDADLSTLTGLGTEIIAPVPGSLSFSLTPSMLDGQNLDASFVEAGMIFDGGDLSFVSLHGSPNDFSVIELDPFPDFSVVFQFPDPSFSVPASSNILGVQTTNTTNDLEGAGLFGSGTATGEMTIVIPEPTSLALLGLGGLAMLRRRRGVA